MNKKKGLHSFFICILIIMFLYPIPTMKGATSGLLLWFHTILPTLLPFLILSNIIISLDITSYVSSLFHPLLKKVFHVSKNGSYPIVMGLLSGFPMGAKTCADMVFHKKISKEEGQYLLALTNNPSITYLVSYVAITTLKITKYPYIFVILLYLSSIISAFLLKKFAHLHWDYKDKGRHITSCSIPLEQKAKPKLYNTVDRGIMNAFETITNIGGYIILFSIFSHIIVELTNTFLPLLPTYLSSPLHYITLFLVGSLEITTGTFLIGIDTISFPIKFLLIVGFSGWGGLSSLAQTYSVIRGSSLSIKLYIITKIMNAIIASIISVLYLSMNHIFSF